MLRISILALLVCATLPAAARPRGGEEVAEEPLAGGGQHRMHLGADAAFVLPMGDWGSSAAGIGVGPLLKFEYDLRPELSITGRLGYIFHSSESVKLPFVGTAEVSTSELPILGGARYYFRHGRNRPYAAAELCLCYLTATVKSISSSAIKIGMTLGGGYQIGLVDVRGALFLPSIGDLVGVMIQVGYTFKSFG